jgi:hypothetical protein
MFVVERPSIPMVFDEPALLAALEARRGEGREGDKLFVPEWRDYKRDLGAGGEHAKCAYCEAVRRVTYELDVEHVRPKSRVMRWKSGPVEALLYPRRILDKNKREVDEKPAQDLDSARDGYWWLAYRWGNYLLACKECNSGWKREFFPVRDDGRRWTCADDEEDDEGVLLLDPAAPGFESAMHFDWDFTEGLVHPKSDGARATIIACGLNRHDLKSERRSYAAEVSALLDSLFEAIAGDNRAVAKQQMVLLKAKSAVEAPFTAMTRSVAEAFYREHGLREKRVPLPWVAVVRWGVIPILLTSSGGAWSSSSASA